MCALCCQNVVCRTLSIKRHFETQHKKSFEDNAEKQSSIFKNVIRKIEGSYKVAESIAKYGKPFIDGVFVKEAFLSCAEVLLDDLPSKCT